MQKQTVSFTKQTFAAVMFRLRGLADALEDGKKYEITIKEDKAHRSQSANDYFWTLCDKVAEAARLKKEDVYREYIRNLGGVSELVKVRSDAVEQFSRVWTAGHLGRMVEVSPEAGGFCLVRVYYGSSDFDTAQMSRLIDLVKQDCEALGIETATPAEISLLLDEWGSR